MTDLDVIRKRSMRASRMASLGHDRLERFKGATKVPTCRELYEASCSPLPFSEWLPPDWWEWPR